MSWFDRIGQAWDALRGVERGIDHATYFGTGYGSAGLAGGPLTGDAWLSKRAPSVGRLVEAYRCVIYAMANINALAVCSVPLRLYVVSGRSMGDRPRSACGPVPVARSMDLTLRKVPYVTRALAAGDRIEEVTSHPLLDTLDNPNEEFDKQAIIYYTSLCLDVAGSAFWRRNPSMGIPSKFYPLEPQHVLPERKSLAAGQDAIAHRYSYFGEWIDADSIVHFKRQGVRDPYGLGYSPTQAALTYAGLEEKFQAIQDQVLSNPRIGQLVSPSNMVAPMGEPERRRLEADLNRKTSGPGAGRTVVSGTPLSAAPTTYPPADIGAVEMSRYDLERIANCFGVPMAMLTTETNLANLQAAERQHGRTAVAPRCHTIGARLTRMARALDSRLFFAFDPVVQDDKERTARVVDMKLKGGVVTINEARLDDGCAPVPWGNEPWLAQTLRQPSEERPEPPQPAPQPTSDAPDAEDDQADGIDAEERALRDSIIRTLARIDEQLQ